MIISQNNLISPFPLYFEGVGHIKSPTLRSIYKLTYDKYYVYLSYIKMTPAQYLKLCTPIIDDVLKSKILSMNTIYPLIAKSSELQCQYTDVFNFFFKDKIEFNTAINAFEVSNNSKICGYINDTNYTEVCNLISSLNNIAVKEDTAKMKFKNAKAKEIFDFLAITDSSGDSKNNDNSMSLGNIISAVCARHNSINMTNVWKMTVCQLYDQFFRLYINVPFDINSIRWAAYGEKDYDYSIWYKKME